MDWLTTICRCLLDWWCRAKERQRRREEAWAVLDEVNDE